MYKRQGNINGTRVNNSRGFVLIDGRCSTSPSKSWETSITNKKNKVYLNGHIVLKKSLNSWDVKKI